MPPDGALDVHVLGPLAVMRGGTELALGGRLQRLVLARLVCDAGRPVAAERLVDEIWGATPPASGTGPLRTYIWELRRRLGQGAASGERRPAHGTGVLVSSDAGYMLDVDRDRIDHVRFESLFASSRAAAATGQPERALGAIDDALGLWRGPAFGDLAGEPTLEPEVTRLDQLLLGARELRAELLLATGREAEAVAVLGPLVQAHPGRERLWATLMVALYRSGRQADALRCFQQARARLIGEAGLEPGPELRELEQAILRQDPDLSRPRGMGSRSGGDRWGVAGWPVDGRGGASGRPAKPPGPAGHGLPRRLTSLIGRTAERAAVAELLHGSRLVTLSGAGGCGKTRLALAVAEDLLPRFPGGVWFADLSAVADPGLVARVLAESVGGGRGRAERLQSVCLRISDLQVLLVLDNCEHLVEAVAALADELLARCGSLRILATSREELRLGAESVWRVPGLSLPDDAADDPARLLRSEAVQLFVERASRVVTVGPPNGGDALRSVAHICRQLDGIPLAIELAAALAGSLSVADIAGRLDDRLRLLTVGHRSSVPRHRTLRAAFDWSFDLLDPPAQRLFAELGVFVGGFTLPQAEAVTGAGPDPLAVARGVGHLVRSSMIDCVSGDVGTPRYHMQETIRQYALERLEQLTDADAVWRRHACFFAGFATEAERHVHGPAASRWLGHVVDELPNLRAAATWAFSHDVLDAALSLAGSLHWFFARIALLDEAARWLDTGLGRREGLPASLRLKALTAASNVAFGRGELGRASRLGEQSIDLARSLDDAYELSMALMTRGATAVWAGELDRANECFVEADELTTRLGNRWGRAWMLTCWSAATHYTGDTGRARQQIEEALEIFRALHDIHGQVLPHVHLALFSLEEGRADEARALASEAARIAASVEGFDMQHVSLCMQGVVELVVGDRHDGRDLLVRSIRDFSGSHNWLILTRAVEALAGLSTVAGEHSDGAALLGFARQMRERWQITPSAAWSAVVGAWVDRMEAGLGADRVEREIARGRTMDLDDALALAEAATAGHAVSSPDPRGG